jgi:prepilin-type N-terminal cleavage/methylation domain-containing protein
MKTANRKSRMESRESRVEGPARSSARLGHSSFIIRHLREGFTLIELLTVIAIIGILAALLAPVIKNFSKPDANVAATRQLLDDCARARALAMSERSTVYMFFVPTNFWNDPFKIDSAGSSGWTSVQVAPTPFITASMVATQLYGAQWNGYRIVSLRDVGDQPGKGYPKDLTGVKTLPAGSFIAPFKFTAPPYGGTPPPYPTNRPDLLIYGFLMTNTIPFPSSDIMTNANFVNRYNNPALHVHFVSLPYIAFNYLGQLTPGDGSVLPYDENIPLDYGSIAPPVNPTSKLPVQGLPSVVEDPPGNSTNISYNIIHVDRLTGRARLERQDQL